MPDFIAEFGFVDGRQQKCGKTAAGVSSASRIGDLWAC